jgi:ribosomal protein L40E
MMDLSEIKKPFTSIITVYIIWAAMCIVIVTLLNIVLQADVVLHGGSVSTVIGISLSATFGFGVGGLGIVLSAIGMNMGQQKPELAKGFGIANFVFILTCLGTMIGGAVMVSTGLVEVIDCSMNDSSPAWRANCALDIIYNSVIIGCMVVIALISVIGIVNSVKVVTIINNVVPRTGFVSTPPASAQPAQTVAASGSQGKFCSACGAPNEPDAKFCKKCGKAC